MNERQSETREREMGERWETTTAMSTTETTTTTTLSVNMMLTLDLCVKNVYGVKPSNGFSVCQEKTEKGNQCWELSPRCTGVSSLLFILFS